MKLSLQIIRNRIHISLYHYLNRKIIRFTIRENIATGNTIYKLVIYLSLSLVSQGQATFEII